MRGVLFGLMLGLAGCGAAPQTGGESATDRAVQAAAAPLAPNPVCGNAGECAPRKSQSAFGGILASALFAAPEVAEARAGLIAARAGLRAAEAGRKPLLGASAQSDDVVLSVSQPIWSGGKLPAAIAAASSAARQAEANLQAVQLDASLKIIDTYGRWLEARGTVGALEQTAADYEKTVEMIARRVAAGVSGGAEAELVAARQSTLEADLLSAEASRDLARAELTALIGAEISDAALYEAGKISATRKRPDPQLFEAAIAQNPTLAAADAGIARAKANVDAARAERMPTVSVVAENSAEGLFSSGARSDGRVYLGMSMALGQGRSNRVAEAQAQVSALEASKALRAGIRARSEQGAARARRSRPAYRVEFAAFCGGAAGRDL